MKTLDQPGATILSANAERASHEPDATALVLLAEDGSRDVLRVGDLYAAAAGVGRALRGFDLSAGDVVLLLLDHGRQLVITFLGALHAGVVPSILPPPTPRVDLSAYASRIRALAEAVGARAVIGTPELHEVLRERLRGLDCRAIEPSELVDAPEDSSIAAPVHLPDALAFLQHTSGTTGLHKAVAHTHGAVMTLMARKAEKLGLTHEDVAVNWIPLYHDMGLISAFLLPLTVGFPAVLMSPFHWVRDPARLPRAIHEFHGTLCWMPNAGLQHCTRAIRDSDLEGVDLSSWRLLASGGEPVRLDSLRAFQDRFAPYGFRRSALHVGYGMAEAVESVATTAGTEGHEVPVDWVSTHDLQHARRAVPTSPTTPGAVSLVSCGTPFRGIEVRIVDDSDRPLPERHVGEITLRAGHLLSGGYYRHPALTAAARRGGWFQTGDFGYLAEGQLYVCGRKKDLIIVGGRNIHPEDLEAVGNAIPGVAPGRVVAFGVPDARTGTDRPVITCELRVGTDRATFERLLRQRITQELDVTIGDIHLAPSGWVIKTSSGKLARAANRDKYLAESVSHGVKDRGAT